MLETILNFLAIYMAITMVMYPIVLRFCAPSIESDDQFVDKITFVTMSFFVTSLWWLWIPSILLFMVLPEDLGDVVGAAADNVLCEVEGFLRDLFYEWS